VNGEDVLAAAHFRRLTAHRATPGLLTVRRPGNRRASSHRQPLSLRPISTRDDWEYTRGCG
jgi:hypothetical protein